MYTQQHCILTHCQTGYSKAVSNNEIWIEFRVGGGRWMSPMLEVFISHGDMAVGTWYLSDDSLPGSLLTSLMLCDTKSSVTIMGLYTIQPHILHVGDVAIILFCVPFILVFQPPVSFYRPSFHPLWWNILVCNNSSCRLATSCGHGIKMFSTFWYRGLNMKTG